MHDEDTISAKTILSWGLPVLGFIIFCIAAGMWGCPQYRVYDQKKTGEAALKKAEFERRTMVETARAKKDAAKFEAAAEIERAKGVAEANRIIGDSLKGNDAYLRYLWIQGLQDGSSETIYVPTEANLPIMEATRRRQ
jgi:hypothetical protein